MSDIFGKSFEEIKAMQQKTYVAPKIKETQKPTATENDIKILLNKGLEFLETEKLFGVIDRLKTSGLI